MIQTKLIEVQNLRRLRANLNRSKNRATGLLVTIRKLRRADEAAIKQSARIAADILQTRTTTNEVALPADTQS